ncbi:competence/damage-inducible protein A [Fundicoccus culcitae]|uniref:Putative competence-damage inducible protein n=1 Tax=Fundicoccus culcitae TaxID=2969821 RepID=A0ABY5P750_9LACT|nr:competence/damage-inducible protein A [Fundicoccus culcitae]UUX34566.1 competence/damage-inducible protein A [Fundicoccus culcitae]
MKAEIIAVGTELLMGYIVNTNTAVVSQKLLDMGIGVYYQQVVGDNEERLVEALKLADSRSDLIILTGGIGPTRDDITKFVVAKYYQTELIQDERQWEKIQSYFASQNRQLSETDYFQALTFSDGTSFFNEVGLACGSALHLEINNKSKVVITLPGPPFEMEHMFDHYARDYINAIFHPNSVIESLYLNFFGLGEAQIAIQLDDLITSQSKPTIAIYAKPKLVTVRLTANAYLAQQAQALNQELANIIINRLSSAFLGYGQNYTIEEDVVQLLIQHKKTLSLAESVTGGLVLESLTDIEGVSKVLKGGFVTYTNQAKIDLLKISPQLIEDNSVVSPQVAQAMAEACIKICGTDFALGLTGVAGPDTLEGHPVGQVFIALAQKNSETQVIELNIPNKPRHVIRYQSKNEALNLIRELLKK